MNIDKSQITEGSFADSRVISFKFDKNKKYMQFKTPRACLDLPENKYIYARNVTLTISEWQRFTILAHTLERTKISISIDDLGLDYIDDILIFDLQNDQLKMCGFAKNMPYWYEWYFEDPKIDIMYDEFTIENAPE